MKRFRMLLLASFLLAPFSVVYADVVSEPPSKEESSNEQSCRTTGGPSLLVALATASTALLIGTFAKRKKNDA
ncbi:MAG: hypothetical protein FWD46_01935 [Cystobacterineae bacterium]|nr:hypothetical protein [Cystobacterineae bacterium]